MVASLTVTEVDVVRSHYPVPILNMEIYMKVGDKVIQVGGDGITSHNQYKDWVGQIVQIDDSIALVKWDPTYPGPGGWIFLSSLRVEDDSAVVGKQ